ncbi:hypothetical protein BDV96DRAFT_531169 [Lophiotrema nucula]|uniref:Rhodopsin domain-containing protein n=1 Tax=Lophiotrema nucula TaxID=690887 RepID=A0A6A5YLZ2_9PLEO|nr:hypothetical protein BDV96DRAFT_531169 [Lophiotrema nucula]
MATPGGWTMAPLEVILMSPALAAPPGADTRMTTNGHDQVWYLVTAITCVAIPGLFLIARIYTKLGIVKMLESADYFIFLAYPLLVVEVVVGYYMVKWGGGVHQWQITVSQLFDFLYWGNAGEVIYSPAIFLVKMAILFQYLRLFAPSRSLNKFMYYGAWSTIVACFCFYTVQMFWTLFYCKPRETIWNKALEFAGNGKCQDHGRIVISQGFFSIISDVVILLLPVHSLWQLQVPLGRKIEITLLFSTGLLAIAAAAMRIFFTVKISPKIFEADVSYYGLFIGLWSEAEVALGFIVACALSLPRLIQAKRKNISRAMSYVVSPFSTMRSVAGTLHSRSRSRSESQSHGSKSISNNNSRTSQHFNSHRRIYEGPEPKVLQGIIEVVKKPEHYEREFEIGDGASSNYSEGSGLQNRSLESKRLSSIDDERERDVVVLRDFDFDLERNGERRESMMISAISPRS